jgi:hypothetical protein
VFEADDVGSLEVKCCGLSAREGGGIVQGEENIKKDKELGGGKSKEG